MTKQANSDQAIAMRVSVISIVANVVLSVFKLLAGVLANSGAMISDAIHSASDVFSTFIVMIGVAVSGKKSDSGHPYGHERMECVASIVLAIILAATGIGIGASGIGKIMTGDPAALQVPGKLALAAAVLSILVKEWMYWYCLLYTSGFPSIHEQYLSSGGQESLQYRQHQYDQRPLDADRRSH